MTDKQRLQYILDNTHQDNIEAIMEHFLFNYGSKLSIDTVNELRKQIQDILDFKIEECRRLQFVARERAGYIKYYLEGKMWPTEELAKEYLQPQIDNCQAIIDACNKKEFW